MTGEKELESWEKCREVGNLAKSWSRMVWMGGWWIFERGRASGEGAGTGACVWGGGGREFEFGLFGFGTLVLLGNDKTFLMNYFEVIR